LTVFFLIHSLAEDKRLLSKTFKKNLTDPKLLQANGSVREMLI